MIVGVRGLGTVGAVLDVEDYDIPDSGFTVADNVRFKDGFAERGKGSVDVGGTVILRPTWLVPYQDPDTGSLFWVYCGQRDNGDNHIATWDGVSHVMRTRRDGVPISLTSGPLATNDRFGVASHTYSTGDWVYLTGTDSTPATDGTHEITNVDATTLELTTFDVTGDGTGVGTVEALTPYQRLPLVPWSGGVLNGLLFVNSGNDVPQKWDRTGGVLDATFEDFTNWPTDFTARVMRPFRNFIFALDVAEPAGVRNPYRVMWSDAADPFTEPSTWIAGADNFAGDVILSEDGGYLIDALTLRGSLIIYRQHSTYICRYIGGNQVFSFEKLYGSNGLLSARCVKSFGDGMHFVVDTGDIYVHNGNTLTSIVDQKVKHAIFDELDRDNYSNAYVVPNREQDEMRFCYPTAGNTIPNKVARWHIHSGAWSFMSVEGRCHIGYGAIPENTVITWDTYADTWDDHDEAWGSGNTNPTVQRLLVAYCDSTNLPTSDTVANAKLLQTDTGFLEDGASMDATLERTGYTMGAERDIDKQIQAIWPKTKGGPINISVGASHLPEGPYTWDGPHAFNPVTDDKVDVRVSGKYYGVRITKADDTGWSVHGYDFELEAEGER